MSTGHDLLQSQFSPFLDFSVFGCGFLVQKGCAIRGTRELIWRGFEPAITSESVEVYHFVLLFFKKKTIYLPSFTCVRACITFKSFPCETVVVIMASGLFTAYSSITCSLSILSSFYLGTRLYFSTFSYLSWFEKQSFRTILHPKFLSFFICNLFGYIFGIMSTFTLFFHCPTNKNASR